MSTYINAFSIGLKSEGKKSRNPNIDEYVLIIYSQNKKMIRHKTNDYLSLLYKMKALQAYLNAQEHLQRPKLARLEQELSLPKILQKPASSVPKSSMQIRPKKKSIAKNFASETTLSPEQQMLHQEIKNAIGGRQSPKFYVHKKNQTPLLPKIKKVENVKKKEVKTGRSVSQRKMDLQNILKDPYLFMQNYFADINKQTK